MLLLLSTQQKFLKVLNVFEQTDNIKSLIGSSENKISWLFGTDIKVKHDNHLNIISSEIMIHTQSSSNPLNVHYPVFRDHCPVEHV